MARTAESMYAGYIARRDAAIAWALEQALITQAQAQELRDDVADPAVALELVFFAWEARQAPVLTETEAMARREEAVDAGEIPPCFELRRVADTGA